jgi:hypothetical protein
MAGPKCMVSFWALPAMMLPFEGRLLRFSWDSGEFSADVEFSEVEEITSHDIPHGLFPGGVPRFDGAVRIPVSTAEMLFVLRLVS